jgi:hypothetical protein
VEVPFEAGFVELAAPMVATCCARCEAPALSNTTPSALIDTDAKQRVLPVVCFRV